MNSCVSLALFVHPEYIAAARELRKRSSQWRDQLIGFQKASGKDRDTARYFSNVSAEEMKRWRLFDYFVRYAEPEIGANPLLASGLEGYFNVCFAEIDIFVLYKTSVYDKVL